MNVNYNNLMGLLGYQDSTWIWILVGSLIVNIGLAFIPAKMARDKGYSFGGFLCLGIFVSFLVAIIVVACLPDKVNQYGAPQGYYPPQGQYPPQGYAPQQYPPQYPPQGPYAPPRPPQYPPQTNNQQPPAAPKFCKNCGSPLNANAAFCTRCGSRVNPVTVQETPEPQEPLKDTVEPAKPQEAEEPAVTQEPDEQVKPEE